MISGCKPPPDIKDGPEIISSRPVSSFTIPSVSGDGATIRIKDFKGQVVLLDFWATWSPLCIFELPMLEKLYLELKPKGFTIIGMTVDKGTLEEVVDAVSSHPTSYPVGLAGEALQQAFGGIRPIPTRFLLDREGTITKTCEGYYPVDSLRKDILALLE